MQGMQIIQASRRPFSIAQVSQVLKHMAERPSPTIHRTMTLQHDTESTLHLIAKTQGGAMYLSMQGMQVIRAAWQSSRYYTYIHIRFSVAQASQVLQYRAEKPANQNIRILRHATAPHNEEAGRSCVPFDARYAGHQGWSAGPQVLLCSAVAGNSQHQDFHE